MSIDWNKPLRTRGDNIEFVVLGEEKDGYRFGLIQQNPEFNPFAARWDKSGKFCVEFDEQEDEQFDLINKPETVRAVGYANVYRRPDGSVSLGSIWKTTKEAEAVACNEGSHPEARIKIDREIEIGVFEE
ncbi:hypothetical protein C4564_01865 [Candidatus Microgenomates bacterium]|nr:MAG: hypothetical protein C4564_01865 [Candidatus Microgenomates bacterium]